MTAAEVVTLVAAAAVVLLAGAMFAGLVALRRALADARQAVEHLHQRAIPALHDMRRAVRRAEHDVGRLDDLIDTADALGRTADAASRLAYESVSSPIIKALAFGAGTRRAARRLRGLEDADGVDDIGGPDPRGRGDRVDRVDGRRRVRGGRR